MSILSHSLIQDEIEYIIEGLSIVSKLSIRRASAINLLKVSTLNPAVLELH
jgi:hypothetical protein